MRPAHTLIAAPVVALLVAACGSSSSSSSSGSTKAVPPTPTPTAAGTVVTTKKDAHVGEILAAGPKRLTVYLFEADKGSRSNCTGTCASAWPPVPANAGPKAGGRALGSDLGVTERADGTDQVTYKGHPLYYYTKDKDSGDAYGQGLKQFGAGWYVLTPSGKKIDRS
jgi:predicted lipoprotein with Yx(FWY)xxD motif